MHQSRGPDVFLNHASLAATAVMRVDDEDSMTRCPMFALVLFGLLLIVGCSKTTSKITTGMKMQDATQMMIVRGISPAGPMAYSANNQSFNLPDGRCLVLIGDANVDAIDVITNPNLPMSERKSGQVKQFEF